MSFNKDEFRELSKYRFLFFIRYFGDSFFYPFIILFLTTKVGPPKGDYNLLNIISNSQIGYSIDVASKIMMILPLIAVFVNPLWAIFSRSSNFNRKLVSLFSLLEAMLIIIFGLLGNDLELTLIVFFLLALVGQPIYLLMDSFTKVYIDIHKINFLKIRIFGSIAYIIGSLLSAVLLSRTNSNYLLLSYVCIISFALTSLITFFIRKNNDQLVGHKDHKRANIKELLTNYNYYAFMFFFVFVFGTQISFDAYLPTYFREVYNLSGDKFAYIITSYVVVEVIFMFILTKWGHKVKTKWWVYFMVYAMVIRYSSYAIGGNIYVIIAITMLRAITMTLYTYLFLMLVVKVVKPHNLTIALLLTNSFFNITKVGLLLLGGKFLTDASNYPLWYQLGAILAFMAIPMYHLVSFKGVKNGDN